MSVDLDTREFVLPRERHRRPVHAHEWRLVSDDVDEFGPVRMFECMACGDVRYS